MNKKVLAVVSFAVIFLGVLFFYNTKQEKNNEAIADCYENGKSEVCSPANNVKEDKMTNNFSQISVQEFKEEITIGDAILIDVRTPEELPIYGKISDKQILIDINNENFSTKISKLNRSQKYLIYCWHGNRSQVARDFMEENGFVYVKDLRGGIDAWENDGEGVLK